MIKLLFPANAVSILEQSPNYTRFCRECVRVPLNLQNLALFLLVHGLAAGHFARQETGTKRHNNNTEHLHFTRHYH